MPGQVQVLPSQLIEIIKQSFSVPDRGNGAPGHNAPEGTMYWDITNDNFYVNNNGAAGWTFIGGGGGAIPHNLLDGVVHPDTVAQGVTEGSLVYGNATPAWDELVISINHYDILGVNVGGTQPEWQTFDWDLHIIAAGGDGVHDHSNANEGGVLPAASIAHSILDASVHTDSAADVVSQGSLIYGNATPLWDELGHPGGAGYAFITTGAATLAWDQTPAWTGLHTFGAGWVLGGGTGDLDGRDLILDTDGDSYIHASADDVIDFVLATATGELGITINGAEDFTFTTNSFNVLTGSNITMADTSWIGNSGASARMVFDSSGARDFANIPDCYVGVNTATPWTIASWSSAGSERILNVYDNFLSAHIAAQGAANGAHLELVDLGGAVDDKWLRLRVDGGVGTFQSMTDAGALNYADIIVMDLGTGQITLGQLTAGYVESSAGGVLSVVTTIPITDISGGTANRLANFSAGGVLQDSQIAETISTGVLTITGAIPGNPTITVNDVSGTWTLGAGTCTAATGNDATIANHTHAITDTSDGATNHSTILSSSAAGALTMDDYFTIDGGTFGISGNELLTVNAAGTFAFSGILGVTVEDADWIGNGAASARLGFDSSGATDHAYFSGCNVGIGTTAPDGTCHVHTASAGVVTASGSADNLVVEHSGDGGISILVPDANASIIYFGSPSDNVGAVVQWQHNSDLMSVGTANAGGEVSIRSANFVEAIRIDANQNVGMGTAMPPGHCSVYDNTVDTTATYYGIYNYHIKTAGATTAPDEFYGYYGYVDYNDAGTDVASTYGVYSYVDISAGISALTFGTAGFAYMTGGTSTAVYGAYGKTTLGTGTVTTAYGLYGYVSAAATMTAVASLVGLYVGIDDDFGSSATNYGIFIDEYTNIDYCIYHSGTAPAAFGGDVIPINPKGQDLGGASNEWDNIFYVTANTGTSRLINSTRDCPVCGEQMKRGTGTLCIMGEDADYAIAFCVKCGNVAMEEWNHLNADYKSKRRAAPRVTVSDIRVKTAGRHREIAIDFDYGDGIRNSTRLGDDELAQFLGMNDNDRERFLYDLGVREWESREENRLMKEQSETLAQSLNSIASRFVGRNLEAQ